jgi:hypothetical protein
MAKQFKTEFSAGTLKIYVEEENDTATRYLIINQPFIPDGSMMAWPSEESALAWWETRKESYASHIEPPPPPPEVPDA